MSEFPKATWGDAEAALPAWRGVDDPDPDDEELAETPPDVIAGLGFDPAKESDAA
ncbi:MAG: hypothetical protein KGL39_56560 [Patescibacteria group bacterium]|nr:hypothetical protein [Patescibacteria group bacterium]